MKSVSKICLTGLSSLLVIAPAALAQVNPPTDVSNLALSAPTDSTALIGKITTILKWIQYGLFLVAAFLVILAAYDYLMSRGDAEGIKKAQGTLLYAVIAIVVGLLAGGLPSIVSKILGVGV